MMWLILLLILEDEYPSFDPLASMSLILLLILCRRPSESPSSTAFHLNLQSTRTEFLVFKHIQTEPTPDGNNPRLQRGEIEITRNATTWPSLTPSSSKVLQRQCSSATMILVELSFDVDDSPSSCLPAMMILYPAVPPRR